MTDETSKILEAITDLSQKVETYHGDFREHRGTIDTKVKSLEDDAKEARLWQNIKLVCVLPVVGALHQIAQHYHWIK